MPGGYHMEYGYSCMGYEIAGGLGVKMARPDREVIVLVGDGSYLMLNSEIATSVMLGHKLVIVVLDNRGYGCINRLQQAVGGAPFNNLFDDCVQGPQGAPRIDFAAHAAAMGALGENVRTIPELEAALQRARAADRTYVVCIETDPARTTDEGGCWWEVAVPEVSDRAEVRARARAVRAGKESAEAMKVVQGQDRHQSDFVEQRRPAVARRRNAARGGADRRQDDRLPGLRARQQVSARSDMHCARSCPRTGSNSCPAGTPASSRGARWTRKSPRSARISSCWPSNGAKVMVYGEVADSIQGAPQPLYKRPRFFADAQWDAYAERLTAFAQHTLAHGVRVAYHHHMGAYVETPADVDAADGARRRRGGIAVRHADT